MSSSAGSGREASALSTHAWATAIVALLGAIVVTGSGIRTNAFQPGHPSFQYTLTLPVARTGGYGPDPNFSEAHVAARYLSSEGIDASQIFTEQGSGTTFRFYRLTGMA